MLGLAAEVQLYIGGDPEVAVAAADWSVQVYQDTFYANGQFDMPREQVFGLRCAWRAAAVVHTAYGHTDLGQPAHANVLSLEPWPEFDDEVARVRDFPPTLAAALHAAGHGDLTGRLARFREIEREAVILVPATRCRMHDAPGVARELVDAQTSLSIGVPQELLLGLEAHALFAEASRRRVPGMSHQFGEFGPVWAVAVMNFGQRMLDFDLDPAARDAARWLGTIVSQVQPHATIGNPRAREVVAAALDWLAVTGDALGDRGCDRGSGNCCHAWLRSARRRLQQCPRDHDVTQHMIGVNGHCSRPVVQPLVLGLSHVAGEPSPPAASTVSPGLLAAAGWRSGTGLSPLGRSLGASTGYSQAPLVFCPVCADLWRRAGQRLSRCV